MVLLNNETNMGFLPSVNRGLKMAENHVALVNTDVEVPEEWLERLMLPILSLIHICYGLPRFHAWSYRDLEPCFMDDLFLGSYDPAFRTGICDCLLYTSRERSS